ncbi:MAG: hypothetical protein ABIP45_12170 [Knoellia sp.]
MSTTRVRKSAKRLALAATAAGAVTIMAANAAMAAPFATQATATAVHLSVIDPVLVVDTGVESAQNDGSTPTVTDSEQPLISVLNGQSVLTAGALGEVAVANNDGTSKACSGVTGQGGTVNVGDPTNCTTPGTSPVVLNLANVVGVVSVRIEAEAITSTCVGAANGTNTGTAKLVGAHLIVDQPLLLPDFDIALDTTVAPNTKLLSLLSPAVQALLSPLVDVTLNKQVTSAGTLSVTAIDVAVIANALASAQIANVTCGPAADLALVPAVPFAGIPVALGTLAIIGGGMALTTKRRRRVAA